MRRLSFLVLASAAVLVGCDDPFAPRDWSISPDTIVLFAADRAEYQGRPAAFDLVNTRVVLIEGAQVGSNWDFALVSGEDGLALAPAGAFSGFGSRAGIAIDPGPFEAVERAPSDTARYVHDKLVALDPSVIYVVRSRHVPDFYAGRCSVYGKIQPIRIDEAEGRFEFTYAQNPNCNDRSLVPTRD